jgi:hypothetical protein
MRPAAEIVAEMKYQFAEQFEGSDGRECFRCRLTFDLFKGFQDVPTARTTNLKTGEMIAVSPIKALPSGHDMRQALGDIEGCRCRGRPAGPFDERFTIRDYHGNPVPDVQYRILAEGKEVYSGKTNAAGQTARVTTQGFKFLTIEVER